MTQSKKAKALLIALVNCDLIFAASMIWKPDPALCASLVTATLTLAAVYIGAQGAVDTANAIKTPAPVVNNSTTQTP